METIIGIDFSTTNSEVAVFQEGRARIIPNAEGEKVIPSAVFIDESGSRYVGTANRNVAILHPERTVTSVKREIGGPRRYWIGDQGLSPEQIASFVFAELGEMSERHLGGKSGKAVVTVPGYFDDIKRRATRRAAASAGLEVVRLASEPTEAALAYGADSREQGTILVYDLGGATFDVSVLQAGEGVFQVLATRGDARLGGDDFDNEVTQLLLGRFREETGIELKEDRLALQKVHQEAERAKMRLSEQKMVEVGIPFFGADSQGPCHLAVRVCREELEELIARYVDKTLRLTRGALQDAGLRPQCVDRLLLVGGSTRIPAVRRAVEELFGRSAEAGLSPEEVVARGAASEGAILAGQARWMALVDVTPLGLGVEAEDERMVTLVARNTVLPVKASALFTTVTDNQRPAGIEVLQGERPRGADNILLGSFRLDGIEQGRRGEPDIQICFDIDVEAIVHVSARDVRTGSTRSIRLSGLNSLDRERIDSLATEARAAELEDVITIG